MKIRLLALTLPETLIAATVLAVVLVVAAMGLAKVRSDLKHRQAWELLTLLDEALSAYQKATNQWPACPPEGQAEETEQPNNTAEPDINKTADCVIAALFAEPASADILAGIPAVLITTVGETGAAGVAGLSVQDAWGHRLRCLTAGSPSNNDRQAVAANGGKPIFISAGADGDFGIKDIVAATDNLRSDELPQ